MLLSLLLLSCSFFLGKHTPCTEISDCFDNFGTGSTCHEGYCTDVEPKERCRSIPANLFDNWEDHRSDFVVGSVFDFTTDQALVAAVELAAKEIQEMPLMDGHGFAVVQCDTSLDGYEEGVDSTEALQDISSYLINELGTTVVIGPSRSENIAPVFEVLMEKEVLLISPTASIDGDQLPIVRGEPSLFWRSTPASYQQAIALGKVIVHSQPNEGTVLIFSDQDSSYAENFAQTLHRSIYDLEVDSSIVLFSASSDMSALLAQYEDWGPGDIAFITNNQNAIVNFAAALAENSQLNEKKLYLTDKAGSSNVLDNMPTDILSIWGSRYFIDEDSIAYQRFSNSLYELNGMDSQKDFLSVYAYDAAWLAFYGLAWSEYQYDYVYGPQQAEIFGLINDGEEVVVSPAGWEIIQAQFIQGNSIDILGVSGALDYDLDWMEIWGSVQVWALSNDEDNIPDSIYECDDTDCYYD